MNTLTNTTSKAFRPLPRDLADVALLDINDVCTAVRMSKSWVHEQVRAGRFPQPAVKRPRCTRWRLSDVRAHLVDWTAQPAALGSAAMSSGDLDNGFGGQGPPHEASGPRAVQVGESAANADARKVRRLDSEGGR